ncbi:ZIP family metal transporter [Halobaculum sp. MBLA0147]|uniref:ZIP family metal transporter n=1 Tax=Halobaculum sp. MBLA0147 TaxID=3079934 RepID=UPI00352509FE
MTTNGLREGDTSGLVGGVAATAALVVSSGLVLWLDAGGGGAVADTARTKLLWIGWVAFASMAVAAWAGARVSRERARTLVWGYGLASGAMITSASVFLLPQAINQSKTFGGFGIALGLLAGYSGHALGHRLAHLDVPGDRAILELTAHSVSAGVIIGVIYANVPELGLLLGLSIVSHKGPAGYAAANRYVSRGGDWRAVLLPAAGVGVAALASSTLALPTDAPAVRGVVFGFATGVFLHVATDFLPRCELGSEIHEALSVEGDAHQLLDRLRTHAVVSTLAGGLVVFLAWLVVA